MHHGIKDRDCSNRRNAKSCFVAHIGFLGQVYALKPVFEVCMCYIFSITCTKHILIMLLFCVTTHSFTLLLNKCVLLSSENLYYYYYYINF